VSRAIHAPSATDYAVLRGEAALAERSGRLRMTFAGDQAAATLTGLLTNDVLALQPGHGQYAAALTPKGKVLADVRVFRFPSGRYLVDAPAAAAEGFVAMVRKYVNPRLSKYTDVSTTIDCIGVAGPHGRSVMAHALACSPAIFDLLPSYASTDVAFGDGVVTVARAADYGVDGFDCFVPTEQAAAVRAALAASGATPIDASAFATVRIEAGRPAYGDDMDAETLSQEARLDVLDAISLTKGCYTGQEVVARLHFRGHVNKLLRGLHIDATADTATRLLNGDARVVNGDADVGEVRSRAVSPRLGVIALAMIRREVETGAAVTVRTDGGDLAATVAELPFSA